MWSWGILFPRRSRNFFFEKRRLRIWCCVQNLVFSELGRSQALCFASMYSRQFLPFLQWLVRERKKNWWLSHPKSRGTGLEYMIRSFSCLPKLILQSTQSKQETEKLQQCSSWPALALSEKKERVVSRYSIAQTEKWKLMLRPRHDLRWRPLKHLNTSSQALKMKSLRIQGAGLCDKRCRPQLESLCRGRLMRPQSGS